MFFEWLYPLSDSFKLFNVFKYITVRSVGGFFTGLLIYLLLGKSFIEYLAKKQLGQYIREEGPKSHFSKKGTPTMGGLLILFAVTISVILWGNWHNAYLWVCLTVLLFFGWIGFLDDYKKIVKKQNLGLRGKYKIGLQFLFSLLIGYVVVAYLNYSTVVNLPFYKYWQPDLGIWYVLFIMLVVTGASNAVNLTDGLDGLVAMPNIVAFATYGIFVYLIGNIKLATYLQMPFVVGVGELAVFCAAVAGATMGFLWYNSYPAQIFMGDVGALSLGAALGMVAVLAKQEILLMLVGGIFVLEAISVITQVLSFKLTGKRVFRMAPLHHHFELKGWVEPKVIMRFWIISFILAVIALSTLKIR